MTELEKLIVRFHKKIVPHYEGFTGGALSDLDDAFKQFHKDLLAFMKKNAVDVQVSIRNKKGEIIVTPVDGETIKAVPMSVLEGTIKTIKQNSLSVGVEGKEQCDEHIYDKDCKKCQEWVKESP